MQASSASSVQSSAVRSSFNPQVLNNPNSDAPGLKVSFRSHELALPTTNADAEQLLHMLFARTEARQLEKRAAAMRVHEQIVYLDFLRRELNEATERALEATRLHEQIVYIELLERGLKEATERALEADMDLGLARARIRALGLSVPFFGGDCATCSEP
ncbi:hypothetical protein GGX14DRAFT_424593 [Mycena pura]|uniref:Uncharacterized protein n=1 Tax=Mycena pura TaxID=153505 RepID=A0AAD6YMR7_9AGAR|nr:hypothetical protein GGX14DRAFT_424593 [Mycena pura]